MSRKKTKEKELEEANVTFDRKYLMEVKLRRLDIQRRKVY